MFDLFDDAPKRKRTLGIRDKQLLHIRAGKKCENCEKKIGFADMQVGHKTAHAKGGNVNMSNVVALCYTCNKLQGTDSWAVFRKKQGKVNKATSGTKSAKGATKEAPAKATAKKVPAKKKAPAKKKPKSYAEEIFGWDL